MLKFFSCFLLNFLLLSTSYAADLLQVTLLIKDHKFEPEIIKLPAGKKIRLIIHNQDSTIEEFESKDLKREKIILPKSKTAIILAPLNPGEYEFFGEFHEDTARGKIIIISEKDKKIDNIEQENKLKQDKIKHD